MASWPKPKSRGKNPAASLPPDPSTTPGSTTDLPADQADIREENEACTAQDLQVAAVESLQTVGGVRIGAKVSETTFESVFVSRWPGGLK